MTAPALAAPTAFADISAGIAAVQARIAAIAAQTGIAAAVPQTGASATVAGPSTQSFASQLAAAGGATATLGDGVTGALGDGVTGGLGGTATGSDVVAEAQSYLGIRYVWGGESSSGMDCSGLVQKSFQDLGITLPRTAAEQQQVGTPVASLADAQPGDLLFFGQPAYHVAIYAGNNELIESPEPGKTVQEVPIYQQPTSIRRIVGVGVGVGVGAGSATGATSAIGGGLSAGQLTASGLNPAVASFAPQFAAAEQQYDLPAGMLAAVAQQESGGNTQAVSSCGAQGLMQLMPSTAAGAGVDAFDPDQAIGAAAKILSRNLSTFNGSVPLALAAYNAGVGAVQQYGGIPPYPQTQNYVRSITAMMAAGG